MSGDTRGGTETKYVDVVADPEFVLALQAKSAIYTVFADAWWLPRLRSVNDCLTTAERRRAREELEVQRLELRRAGQLLDTADAIITHHLAAELDARGWNHDQWPALPAGVASAPGRRRGSRNEGKFPAKLRVRIEKGLADRLVRATYELSRPATEALMELADAKRRREISGRVYAAEYEELSKEIVTTGEVLRAALIRATADFFPTTEPVPSTEPKLWEEPELLEHIPADQTALSPTSGDDSRRSA